MSMNSRTANMTAVSASDNIEAAAQAVWQARTTRTPIPRISETFGITTLADAYSVASVNTQRQLKNGAVVSGKKIGLTSKAVQQQLGVDQPDFGVLLADMEYLTGDTIDTGRLTQPKAEGEIAFVVGRDMPQEGLTWSRFLSTLEFALPAIEIVDSAIIDWKITLVDTVADNASSGLYVLGRDPKSITSVDLVGCSMSFTKNGNVVSQGSGAACLGHPLAAAYWLARTMADAGAPLKAGEVILSGALGPMFVFAKGDHLELDVQGFGKVVCDAG
jgi:2-keto-4-pentenoate hydratase